MMPLSGPDDFLHRGSRPSVREALREIFLVSAHGKHCRSLTCSARANNKLTNRSIYIGNTHRHTLRKFFWNCRGRFLQVHHLMIVR
jgi:hypothetical protein